ncbi:unnamed protein product [Pedinophyceae sp. YPF-701]|nr:unnamed protein product [Pedinophyceae sp. YPF-701]
MSRMLYDDDDPWGAEDLAEPQEPGAACEARFATADAVPDAIAALSHQLAAQGVPGALVVPHDDGSNWREACAALCNALHAALADRQADLERSTEAADRIAKLRSDLLHQQQATQRATAKLEAREREVGEGLVREHAQEIGRRQELHRLTQAHADLQRRAAALVQRDKALRAEMRRREGETERLHDRLASLLRERAPPAAADNGWAPAGRAGAARRNGGGAVEGGDTHADLAPATEADMLKGVIAAYEDKHRELLLEVRELRAQVAELDGSRAGREAERAAGSGAALAC